MANNVFLRRIKLVVLIGYVALFGLVLFGLFTTYRQLVHLSKTETIIKESEELKLIGKALFTLYKTESTNKMLLSEDFRASVDTSSNEVNKQLMLYLDSIYTISTDVEVKNSIDSVKLLLRQKNENLNNITALMDSIRKLPYSNVMNRKVISRKATHDLSQIITESSWLIDDTTLYIREKRDFLDRVKSVFVDTEDSVRIISKRNKKKLFDTLYVEPTKIITDTIINYVNKINRKSDRKKIIYMTRLSSRQTKMLHYDKLLTLQVKNILQRVEVREKRRTGYLAKQKESLLRKSSTKVSNIALFSLVVAFIFIVLSLIQINKVLKYNKELEETKIRINFLAKSREKLLLMISHDIKAPLSSIIGHIELLYQKDKSTEEKESLDNMRNSSEQILNLSNKLLEYHKLEKGESPVTINPFEPYLLLKDIVKSFSPIVQQKQLYLKENNNIPKKAVYLGDPFIVTQIFNNLISNAVKFTSQGGIEITSEMEWDKLKVSVKDTGIGINEENKKQIFQEFQRINSIEAQRKIEGHGLGLSITLKLIQLLKGTLQLDSELGKGSTFTVKIPLTRTRNKTNIEEKKDKQQHAQLFNKKVLFVDDDVAMLNVYSKIIKKEGAKIITCSDSIEALEIVKNNFFDIIFTDVQMPKMNGLELVKRIRKINERCEKVPIIALSADSDISSSDFAKVGFTHFLMKPVDINQLIQLIANTEKQDLKQFEPKNVTEATTSKSNFESLFEFVKEDRETSLEIIQTFFNDNKEKIKQLKKGLKEKDNELIQSTAHKSLPLMRMIQANSLVNLLEKMETGKIEEKELKHLIHLFEEKNRELKEYMNVNFSELL